MLEKILSGKVAFISGSSKGIGWAAAQLLAQEGCSVILNGHKDRDLLNRNLEWIKDKYQSDALAIMADFGDSKQIKDCFQQIYKKYKQLDIVVNNAGIMEDALLGMIPDDKIAKAFNINAIGVLQSIQQSARLMMRQKSGSIINISSIMAIHGNPGQALYSASKAAVIGVTKSAAKELAPYHIRVNCVAPGFIETDLTKNLSESVRKEKIDDIFMKQPGKPMDVAQMICFLASPYTSYVTGQVIGIDGGMRV
ncbi:MAG: SDR family NAD(P)-dependent oxidoreductase [Waddliaceae bacterium]